MDERIPSGVSRWVTLSWHPRPHGHAPRWVGLASPRGSRHQAVTSQGAGRSGHGPKPDLAMAQLAACWRGKAPVPLARVGTGLDLAPVYLLRTPPEGSQRPGLQRSRPRGQEESLSHPSQLPAMEGRIRSWAGGHRERQRGPSWGWEVGAGGGQAGSLSPGQVLACFLPLLTCCFRFRMLGAGPSRPCPGPHHCPRPPTSTQAPSHTSPWTGRRGARRPLGGAGLGPPPLPLPWRG